MLYQINEGIADNKNITFKSFSYQTNEAMKSSS